MILTCKIQWVDNQGNPTPDDNPAVALAVCQCSDCGLAHGIEGSPVIVPDSRPYPICAQHLAYLNRNLPNWKVLPLTASEDRT